MIYQRLIEPPAESFLLFGIRGVGKNTWIRQSLPISQCIDLQDEALFRDLLVDTRLFQSLIANIKRNEWIAVNETCRMPTLLNEIRQLIEDRGIRFALTCSSVRELKTEEIKLFDRSIPSLSMYPLVPEELRDDFDLDLVLRTGSIPSIWTSTNPIDALQSYMNLYLREQIREAALVRNLGGFVRFLPVAALMHGRRVNTSRLARDSNVARSTVESYLNILEDTLLTFRLPAFKPGLRKRERRGAKLYWVDPGLVRAFKRQVGNIAPEERGSLFEGWVLSVLRTHNTVIPIFDDISFWSPTNSSVEVDFVLQLDSSVLAIDTSSAVHYSTKLLSGLRAIKDLPELYKRILVYGGDQSFKTDDDIHVWSANDFPNKMRFQELWG